MAHPASAESDPGEDTAADSGADHAREGEGLPGGHHRATVAVAGTLARSIS